MEPENKFPWKSLAGCFAYEVVARVFDIFDYEIVRAVRPDIFLAHPLYGYCLSALGRFGAERVEALEGREGEASGVVAGAGLVAKELVDIVRYGTLNAFEVGDILGGIGGILFENYQAAREDIKRKGKENFEDK